MSIQIVGSADLVSCPGGGVMLATLTTGGLQVGITHPVCNGLKGDIGATGNTGPQGATGPGLFAGAVILAPQGATPAGFTCFGKVRLRFEDEHEEAHSRPREQDDDARWFKLCQYSPR